MADSTALRRLEELGLYASAPPGQLMYDGWLLRLLPGRVKRARSINPVYPARALYARFGFHERYRYWYRDATPQSISQGQA